MSEKWEADGELVVVAEASEERRTVLAIDWSDTHDHSYLAEQIVREHNAHDALVEALNQCIEQIEELEASVRDYYESGIGGEWDEKWSAKTNEALQTSRAALALATGDS